jgi:hypothetical protein
MKAVVLHVADDAPVGALNGKTVGEKDEIIGSLQNQIIFEMGLTNGLGMLREFL